MGIPVWLFAALFVTTFTALGFAIRFGMYGHLSLIYCVFSVFF